jgi:hypothetical protein
MARMTIDAGLDKLSDKLGKLEGAEMRNFVERIVKAGADAAAAEMKGAILSSGHHVTGRMAEATGPAEFHHELRGGYQNVYPQGEDGRGVSNALKAYVVNYGLGARMTVRSGGRIRNKTGDKFITKRFKTSEAKAQAAMAAEAERALKDLGLTD